MIDYIRLRNFKCFREAEISFGRLTVLSGLNGAGKSSVIQAVLALRQWLTSAQKSPWRGPLVNLGSLSEVRHEDASDDGVRIEASFFRGEGNDHIEDRPEQNGALTEHPDANPAFKKWLNGDIFYLSADRLGPRDFLPYQEGGHASTSPLGTRGEHVLWYLKANGSSLVNRHVRHPNEQKKTLEAQTSAWLQVISPGVELSIDIVSRADLAIAFYQYARDRDVLSSKFRAGNVGFGLSYGLPSVVALLAPTRGANGGVHPLIIIENPEAHLHPAGQTKLAELAARAAAGGVQVILETHSDHILNGIRLAVVDQFLSPSEVTIHYLERQGLDVNITTPVLTPNGRLDVWPAGFFDQHERNLSRLIRFAASTPNHARPSR